MILKVATWNISGGVIKDVSEHNYFDQEKSAEIDETFLNEIIKLVDDEKIDIIAFQEIITTERIKYISKISEQTNLKFSRLFELSECNLVQDTDCGLAILSKYEIVDDSYLKFTNPKLSKTTHTGATYYTYDKGCMRTKIMLENNYINFITAHGFPFRRFNSDPSKHPDIFRELKEFIENYDNIIATGDFNAENIDNFILSSKVKGIFNEITTVDDKKFDNILLEEKYKVIDKKIIKSLSDHFLCITTIEID